jgi:hypothetical protein
VELTVDTNVLVKSDAAGDRALRACVVFLNEFKASDDLLLVLDEGGLIKAQYLRNLKAPRFGHKWLTFMLLRSRTRLYPRARIPKRALRKLLDERHLDPRDLKLFVRVALASPDRRIITHDGDFWGGSRWTLKHELDITVDSAGSMHDEMCVRTLDECYERWTTAAESWE